MLLCAELTVQIGSTRCPASYAFKVIGPTKKPSSGTKTTNARTMEARIRLLRTSLLCAVRSSADLVNCNSDVRCSASAAVETNRRPAGT